MGVAALYNIPTDPVSFAEWSFSHAAHHADIIRFIVAQDSAKLGGQVLAAYVLDPINTDNMALWEYQHQVMHNQMNAVLGIAGQNLTGIDWTDPEAIGQFIDDNASEHLKANRILGIP